jgi:hypothetical protein
MTLTTATTTTTTMMTSAAAVGRTEGSARRVVAWVAVSRIQIGRRRGLRSMWKIPPIPPLDARASCSRTMRAKDGSTTHNVLVDPNEARSPCGWNVAMPYSLSQGDNHDGWSFRSVRRRQMEGVVDNTTQYACIVDVDVDADDVDVVINDGEQGRREGGDDTTDDRTIILVKCGCPTVDGWAEAELEEYSKRLAADARGI